MSTFRQPTADFLLSEGQSMTWLLGNKLITVTTSGCSQKALKNGLCDKCWQICRLDKGKSSYKTISFELYVIYGQLYIFSSQICITHYHLINFPIHFEC